MHDIVINNGGQLRVRTAAEGEVSPRFYIQSRLIADAMNVSGSFGFTDYYVVAPTLYDGKVCSSLIPLGKVAHTLAPTKQRVD